MIQAESVKELIRQFSAQECSCLMGTLIKDDPKGLGRIVRDSDGKFLRIVEHKDASPEQLLVQEVNMSTYLFDRSSLLWALEQLKNTNSQAEYYLTDCPEILLQSGKNVDARAVLQPCEALSINTIDELKMVEAKMTEMGYPCKN
jgi:bifunctional UDP-N-acetylglucosamine pyrophosphorylase/glucosamine-1-phosphate N-acetyltransferase/UDP-N-acetylglucosamine pyrophosphorylase